MAKSGRLPGGALLAVALVCFASAALAATTVMHVKLGDSFGASIAAAGTDTVEADFNAAEGTAVRVAATATRGSTLRPTITVRDGAGATVGQGTTLSIEWLPAPNIIYDFVAPSSGNYVVVIGATSGSGGFTASITGALPAGVQMTAVSGTVTNDLTGEPIPDAVITVGPYRLMTDASGAYSGSIPSGDYDVTVEAGEFLTGSETLSASGSAITLNVGLAPRTPVKLTASASGDMVPGGTVMATVTVDAADGSTVQTYSWTQSHGAPVVLAGDETDTATVTLGTMTDFREELMHLLAEPPVTQEQLPENVQLPEGEFPGGLQNRFEVVGVNPFMLEETGVVTLDVEVTTTSGTYDAEVEIHIGLPWKPTAGLHNVPVNVPVLLHGKEQATYDWTLTPPGGSSAALMDATSQNPEFTPDMPGLYMVEVTDESTTGTVSLPIYAGTWRGVIAGQDFAGRPVPDGACLTCHTTFAADKFTPWVQTGHAEIFTNNLNTSTHYSSNCFSCHSVGYDTGNANGGFDEASDYSSFLAAGLLSNPGDNWDRVLSEFPDTAHLANIQCENCHGPQDTEPGQDGLAHAWNAPLGAPRTDISSDVCATCHGEPLRHARYQQWQLSAHANYELAIDEGESGNCSRCHTGNGFLNWFDILTDDDPETDPLDNIAVDWTSEETHPQTCATCHDPHQIGTTSGGATNATVRISGDTPALIGGFTATDVGRGAICMTCHNSRRGLRNDSTFDDYYLTSEAARAPHGSAQSDVLMGQNAYFIEPGNRGGHSFLEDTCVTCHMAATPPPSVLSYNQGGTNHTFFASTEICSDCHDGLTADTVQDAVHRFLDDVQILVERDLLDLIGDMIAAGNTVDLNGDRQITNVGEVAEIVFGEARGRQAITVTFTDTTTLGPYRLSDVDVLDPGAAVLGQLYDFAEPNLIKAGWNWGLFHNDGSAGVHNPLFAFQGLIAARDALSAVPTETRSSGPVELLQRSGFKSIRNERARDAIIRSPRR